MKFHFTCGECGSELEQLGDSQIYNCPNGETWSYIGGYKGEVKSENFIPRLHGHVDIQILLKEWYTIGLESD
jgi:hypothetical protein